MPTFQLSDVLGKINQDQANLVSSTVAAGMIERPTFIDQLDGSFYIGSAPALLHDNAQHTGNLATYAISDGTFVIPEGETTYLIVSYNSGSPEYQVTQDVNVINESDVIPVYTLYNEGDILIHKVDWNSLAAGTVNSLNMRFVKTDRFGHESGISLGEDGTNRYVTISSGIIWTGAVRHNLDAFNSNTDRWLFWAWDGTQWNKTVTTSAGTYNNTQYQGPTGLENLGPNQFTVNWVFRDADNDAHAGYILGTDSYGTAEAAALAPFPDDTPGEFSAHGLLVGRIIVENGSNVAAQIDSAFVSRFLGGASPSDHSNLTGIQGDAPYYHSDQAVSVDSIPTFADATIAGILISTLDDTHHVHDQGLDTTDSVNFDNITADGIITGGENWTWWDTVDTGFTAEINKKYSISTFNNSNYIDIVFPTTGAVDVGDTIVLSDYDSEWGSISPIKSVRITGSRIRGSTAPYYVDIPGVTVTFVWVNDAFGFTPMV